MTSTGWVVPTARTVDAGSGTWTNDANVLVDDGTEATFSLTSKNTTGRALRGQTFGFDSLIPAGSTVDTVEIRAEWRVNSTSGVGNLELQAFVSGSAVGSVNTNSAEPTTLTTNSYNITAARSWTRADLLNGTLELRTWGRNGNSTNDPSYRWDAIAVQVAYTAVVEATLAAPLGSLTGAIAAGVQQEATLAAPLGSLTANADATVEAGGATHEAVLDGPLGALTGAASGTVEHPATLAGPLGEMAGAAAGTVEHPATFDGPLGTLTASMAADVSTPSGEVDATLDAPLGGLAASASAEVTHLAVAAAAFGALEATVTAAVEHAATLDGPLGSFGAELQAAVTHLAILDATLGSLVAAVGGGPEADPTPYRVAYLVAAAARTYDLAATGTYRVEEP